MELETSHGRAKEGRKLDQHNTPEEEDVDVSSMLGMYDWYGAHILYVSKLIAILVVTGPSE
jgi:hypothetical protein